MRRGVIAGFTVPLVLLAGAGGYAWADAEDLVPGFITKEPTPPVPAPFLSATNVAPAAGSGVPLDQVGDGAPMPDATAVQALAQALRDDPRTGRSTNIAVVDLATGQILASVDGNNPQVPASNTKILTTVAAVHTLGPDFRLVTQAKFDPSTGVVTLVGGGDMMLAEGRGHLGEGPTANGWAGMADLADEAVEALTAAGFSQVTVMVDDTAFPGPAIPAAWPDYVIPQGYGAPVTGLAVNVGRRAPEVYAQRWPDPSAHAGEVFAQRLVETGVQATYGGKGAAGPAPTIASVESAPLWRIAELINHESDNTVAEMLSRVLALQTGLPATPQGAVQAITASLESLGVDTTGLVLYDGAGYSNRNQISPLQLTQAMQLTLQDPNTNQFLQWLPMGSMEGTVRGRFAETPAAGLLRAKTGSLTGVTSIAGVMQTADGRVLLFAILADGMPPGQERPRTAIDEFIASLAQCGC